MQTDKTYLNFPLPKGRGEVQPSYELQQKFEFVLYLFVFNDQQ